MKSFRLENFKSFKDTGDIVVKPITILVGKNSCGKSSLLRFPAVLAQTAQNRSVSPPISFFGDYIDYGNIECIKRYGSNEEKISFSISYDIDIENDIREVRARVTLGKLENIIIVEKFELYIEESLMVSYVVNDISKNIYEYRIYKSYSNGEFIDYSNDCVFKYKNTYDIEFIKFIPRFDQKSLVKAICESKNIILTQEEMQYIYTERYELPDKSDVVISDDVKKIIECYKLNIIPEKIISKIFNLFVSEFNSRTAYIGPFRKTPDRIYRFQEAYNASVGSQGENVADMLMRDYHKNKKLYNYSSDWLKKSVGYELSLKSLDSSYFQLQVKNEIEANIMDVGFGISQILPIIVEISFLKQTSKRYAKNNISSLLLVEQPELHLHPAAQASIAELFVDYVLNSSNNQCVIETHSEHLISKLQVMIADKNCKLTNDMIAIYSVEKDESDKISKVSKIRLDETGRFIDEWPTGFFDKSTELAMELMMKVIERNDDRGENIYGEAELCD